MKNKFLKADIFPIRIEFEEDWNLIRTYYANAKLLEKNILIYTSYREFYDEEEFVGIPVQEIYIQFISKKGYMYSYDIYSSTDYSLCSLQIDRIIIDAMEELSEYHDDDEIIKFMTGNMHSGGVEYSESLNRLAIPEKIDIWMPLFVKIREAYINRQSKINYVLDELPT